MIQQKGDRRDQWQVLANCGTGLVCSYLYYRTGNGLFLITLAASFAASNADTWASELGILSRKEPRSILTLKPLPRGTSGAVSAFGFAASASGAMVIALAYLLFAMVEGSPVNLLRCFVIITASGLAGSVLDSALGATVQAQYRCSLKGNVTERPYSGGKPNSLISGIKIINNDTVNFLSIALSVSSLYLLFMIFMKGM